MNLPHSPRRVVVLGDINVDILAPIRNFTGLGHDYLAAALAMHGGGVGANTAIALARWGQRARLLGTTGRDAFARLVLSRLKQQGVDVSAVRSTPQALTGLMFIPVTRGGQRTFFGSRGANAFFPGAIQPARCLRGADALHLMGYNFLSRPVARAAKQLLAAARRRGLAVSLDVGMGPARDIRGTILQVARQVDILFLSEEEAAALTGERKSARAVRALQHAGLRRLVVKRGRRGCLVRLEGREIAAPSLPVATVDTTGCGDAFTAAFLHGRLAGWRLEEAALVANAAGAAAATVVGAGEQLPGPAEVWRLLKKARLKKDWEGVRYALIKRMVE
ncbi:MAG: carbohydrate kinase family protein [Candidatus Acidiferrales bacterium]